MAEGLAFNIAESVLKQAGSLALQEIVKILGVEGELTNLSKTVTRIQVVFLDAEDKKDHSNQDIQWLNELKEVVYEADDLLDDFATEILRRKAMGGSKIMREVRMFFSCSNQICYGHGMAGRIMEIRESMKNIAGDKLQLHMDARPKEKARQEETESSPPDFFVGREGVIDHVISLLMTDNNQIVSLVGIGGIGKTALAQKIFNHERVINHFQLKTWVYVSDTSDVKMVAKKILESLEHEMQPDAGLETVLKTLEKQVGGRMFLFVLDDVWNNEKWDTIRKLMRMGGKGSKILVTTRFDKVARIASPSFHRLDNLSPADSASLLKQIVFSGRQVNTHEAYVVEKIAGKCDGVPLSIKSTGNLLLLTDPETQWSDFVSQDPLAAVRNANAILPTLRSSYDHLPLHLKQCFAYCSLFPKDFVIDVKSLIHLWVAQGFITKSSDGTHTLEDIGSEYFMDLSRMSFFTDVENDTLGMAKSCKLSHPMQRLATSVASTECKMMSQNDDRIASKVHHVSLNFNLDPPQGTPDFLFDADHLRTFLLPAQQPTSDISRTWDDSSCKALVSCFKRLRVFDLHNTGIENLSSSVKILKQVRYLDMSRNGIKLLPKSISKLQNLQVLKVSDCREITELPNDIVKLVSLQHIYCEGCSSLIGMPIGIGDLTSLQTLTWFVVSKDGTKPTQIGGPSVLKKLKNIRGRMEIRNLGWRKAKTSEFKDASMMEKESLQSLTLRWNGNDETKSAEAVAKYDEEVLSGLRPHQNLRELQVYSYGGASFPGWLSSLINLVNIRVDGCRRCKSLPPLSSVQSLRELCIVDLTDLEYIVDENVESFDRGEDDTMFFPSLKTILLLNCPKLKGWRKGTVGGQQVALPQFLCLSQLEVKNCPKLTSLPRLPTHDGRLSFNATTNLEPAEKLLKIKTTLSQDMKLPSWLVIPGNLVEIWITECKGCEILPAFDQIAFLKDIYLGKLPNSKYINVDIDSSQGEASAFFPFLKNLWIWECPELRGWKTKDNGGNSASTTPIAPLPEFPCLSMLDIRDCSRLSMMPSCAPTLEEKLFISKSSLVKVPSSLPSFVKLQELWINDFPELEFLDLDATSYVSRSAQSTATIFPSLKKLWLENCPKLKGWWNMTDDDAQTMKREEFPEFACLSFLEVKHCPQLSWMPTFPTLQERFYFVNSGVQSFPKRLSFTNLQVMWIDNVPKLEFLDLDGDSYITGSARAAAIFPSLKTLWLHNSVKLKGWWKMTDDEAQTIKSEEFPLFPRLSFLEVKNCPELSWMPAFPSLQENLILDTTSTASLCQTMKMTTWAADSSSHVHPLSNLKELQLKRIDDLDSLPEEWLKNLISLEKLYIESCSGLTSLPKGMHHLTSLKEVEIWYCPQLTERYERNNGTDWPNIGKKPKIKIDGKEI